MAAEIQRRDKEAAWRSDQEATLRSYLLGLASAEERELVEQRLLTDTDYFDEFQRMEERLIDEYVRGEIPDLEKLSHFLKSAEHREDLELALLLKRYFLRQDNRSEQDDRSEEDDVQSIPVPPVPRRRTVMEAVLASAVILFMVGTLNLFKTSVELGEEVVAAQERERYFAQQLTEQQQAVKEQQQLVNGLRQQLAEQQIRESLNGVDARDIISISLNPGLVRTGVNIRQVTIPASAQVLRLNLKLQNIGYPSYRAEIETVDGAVVWNVDGLKARHHILSAVAPGIAVPSKKYKELVLLVPTKLITHSQYLIKLTGVSKAGIAETIGTYYMEIAKK